MKGEILKLDKQSLAISSDWGTVLPQLKTQVKKSP
jgi:hypothetical protein